MPLPLPHPHPHPPDDCGDLPDGCPPHLVPLPPSLPLPPPPVSHGRRNALIIAAAVLAFLCACLSLYLFIRRRRLRLRQALLDAPEATAPAAVPEEEEGGGEEVVHHAWHIRTVGLDEAAIKSIALTRYRAGAGMLGAAYCSVCLGEFRDGELLRLLPNCGHAFHVPCIDTWLRTHINCPLCRADVLDPTATGDPDPPASANAGTVAEQASNNIETLDHEQPGPGQQQNEQQELRVQIDQRDQPSSPEQSHRHPGSRMQNFRRVASTDSYLAPAAEAPEDEQNKKEKQGNGSDAACCEVSLSGSGRLHLMKRSLSAGGRWSLASRHCRTRSSVPPL